MDGLLGTAELLIRDADLDPVVLAAVVSFAFVLVHPFDDGNGRLHRWLSVAVDDELRAELDFLVSLSRAREEIADIVDMPDRLIVLFIKLCRQHGGRLSARKRQQYFSMLSDEEVSRIEDVVVDRFFSSEAK